MIAAQVPDWWPYTPEIRQAYNLLLNMTQEQRALVLCWFCGSCFRYLGPGDCACRCEDDE